MIVTDDERRGDGPRLTAQHKPRGGLPRLKGNIVRHDSLTGCDPRAAGGVAVSGGVVVGGWSYVIAAYAVTGIALLLYGVSLMSRLRAESRREANRSSER